MTPIVNVVLPVFGLILAGYIVGHFRLLGEASSEAISRFVYYCALPAFIFGSLARMDPARIFDPTFLAAYGGGMFAVYAAALALGRFVFKNERAEASLFAMGSIFANSGYLGIPLALVAFGPAGTLPAVIATVFMSVTIVAIVTILVETDPRRRKEGSRVALDAILSVFRSMLVMPALLGVAWSLTGFSLPIPVITFLDLLGAAAGPCALFAIGLFLVGKPIRQDLGEIGAMVAIKLLLHPLVTWIFAFHVFAVDPEWATIAVVMAATPSGANCFVVAQHYGIYVGRASSGILISTVASVVTVSLLFSFWVGN